MDLDRLLQNQREYFRSGATLPVDFRVAMLKKLRDAVERHEEEIAAALKADLGKSDFEGVMCETGLVKSELSYMIRHTRHFAARRRVHTPLAQFASASYQQPSPYGNVLIMSPWNYPFLLTIDPLADAIAAGKKEGISEGTMRNAARGMQLENSTIRQGPKGSYAIWYAPEQAPGIVEQLTIASARA